MSCNGSLRRLCAIANCQECFKKSFASHPRAKCWSRDNEIAPRQALISSNKKYKFVCNVCNHTFESTLYNVKKGQWCPFCSSRNLCDKDCTHCFEKSFASHPRATCWSRDNEIAPRQALKSSHKKYKFDCHQCNHTFETQLKSVTNCGQWCTFCSNKQLCNKDCIYCFKKSFASHPKAAFWSCENGVSSRQVFISSGKKLKFDCIECKHTFESPIYQITNGSWCPKCKNKTELKLYTWLLSQFPQVQKESTFDWCKNAVTGRLFRFDFLIPNQKLFIELDGAQHFRQVLNWEGFKNNQERDVFKMQKANEQGYSIIRILQIDVYRDKYDWQAELMTHIQINREYPTTIYICKNNEYDEHQKLYASLSVDAIELKDSDTESVETDEG